MDEIALRKGHRYFVVIVTSRGADEEIALLGVPPDWKKETVVAFLVLPSARIVGRASSVSALTYVRRLHERCQRRGRASPRAAIDRFHVAKAYRECADKSAQTASRESKQGLEEKQVAQRHDVAVSPQRC